MASQSTATQSTPAQLVDMRRAAGLTRRELAQLSGVAQPNIAAYENGDEMLRLAAEAILHRIGEAVIRLDGEFTASHPEVRWRAMKGMRNLVAHGYGAVDYGILWNALAHSLPREAAHVRRILDEGP
ncbi:DUF86 domain-containing protein [Streptomyces sp. AC563]|uniref:HepT-like ribonuclease domain-containing protein n=1 Tax=Streptomyces buecherae TaxID=2763006 RepID=UPI00164D1C92|nr:HepT-like ribonuclease domain-containing protein [Streptomyces buecherae]MBC3992909.1 DUF86 domain-containing protein [Streptomyces buecherae]